MIEINLKFFYWGLIPFGFYKNGFLILRLGRLPRLTWTLFAVFKGPEGLGVQYCSERVHYFKKGGKAE